MRPRRSILYQRSIVPHPAILLVTHDTSKPFEVGDSARLGGGAVVCGSTVGRDAVVAAVEDDVPDDGVWMGGWLSGVFEE